jgi:hypothetical protein
MQVPPDWKVERQHPGRLDFYSVTTGSPGFGLLMFSRWPPQSSPDEIPDLVRKLADGFLERGKGGQVNLVSDSYTVESFGGERCKGNYAVFQTGTNGNAVAAMFMMSVNGEIWNGQFTGTMDDWVKSLQLLGTIKPRGL